MKKSITIFLTAILLTGCTAAPADTLPTTEPESTQHIAEYAPLAAASSEEISFTSVFDSETLITLGDTVTADSDAVYTSNDIVYYEDRDSYDSGNPYGEGEAHERHTAEEAAAHTVVNITAPGRYRITGQLEQGQILVDLGEDAYENPDARVELILDNANITCTVAPAILFLNVYECDGSWSADTAKAEVDTTNAGAALVLEGQNTVAGSHVARIYKDQAEEKKLWKMDGAIYSFMSMNVYGPGSLDLTADNEGLDTELHLTVNGGNIAIRSDNDGINTNEDGVSVTTINGGSLHIIAGLGAEGDGIDSNGYLVINGGIVVAAANPAADAGLDSDLGSYINGGTVVALGSTMDWAESDSQQVTMNLQFATQQSSDAAIVVTRQDGTVIFAYDPSEDEILGENVRRFQGAVISCPNFQVEESYHVYLDGQLTGSDNGGIYDVTTLEGYENGVQQSYTGSDLGMRPGGMGGRPGGQMPSGGVDKGERPEMPEDWQQGEMPEMPNDWQPGGAPDMPDDWQQGDIPQMPDNWQQGEMPEMPDNWQPGDGPEKPSMDDTAQDGESSSLFFMQDKVNAFSGITAQ